jgi:predicted DNA-binding transcriptional regulator AlpA
MPSPNDLRQGNGTQANAIQPETLDIRDAAALLGISPRHLENLYKAGKAPSPLRMGRIRRWRPEAFRKWLANGCPEQTKKRRTK